MAHEAVLRKTVPVGGKNDSYCPNSVMLLPDRPITFGRIISPDVSVRLTSKTAPLMISRRHATVSVSAGKWTIVDHESLNGVFINRNRIQPSIPHLLEPGDRVVFGVGVNSNTPEFEYVFEHIARGRKRCADSSLLSNKDSSVKQRKIFRESGGYVMVPFSTDHPAVHEAISVAEEKIQKLKASLEEKEKCHADVVLQLEKTEKELQTKLLDQKATLEKEKHELEGALKTLFAEKLMEKEEQLNQELKSQKESLIEEKKLVEMQLQEELKKQLEEKDKQLENQLTQQKEALEQVIAEKEARQNMLHIELENYKASQARMQDLEANERKMESTLQELRQIVESKNKELLKQKEETKRVEEVARKTVIEQMEDEFSCIICQDLFINSTTLPCAHSFCEYCLMSWLQKKNNCPICRQPIVGRPVRSLVLDNAIAKMVESMDEETKTRRQTVTQEREELKRAASTAMPGSREHPITLNDAEGQQGESNTVTQAMVQNTMRHMRPAREPRGRQAQEHRPAVHQRNNYGNQRYYENRYHGNHGSNGGGGAGYRYSGSDYERQPYQHNYMHGLPGTYYPGYGHCHLCGMRGHWAPGCPLSH